MRAKTAIIVSLGVCFASAMPGCLVAAVGVGAAAGYGTYKYVKGELTTTENISLNKAWAATQAGVKDLEFRVKDQAKDSLGANMTAIRADDTEVTIKLEAQGESSTRFSIRVGTLGDESKSTVVMDAIRKHF